MSVEAAGFEKWDSITDEQQKDWKSTASMGPTPRLWRWKGGSSGSRWNLRGEQRCSKRPWGSSVCLLSLWKGASTVFRFVHGHEKGWSASPTVSGNGTVYSRNGLKQLKHVPKIAPSEGKEWEWTLTKILPWWGGDCLSQLLRRGIDTPDTKKKRHFIIFWLGRCVTGGENLLGRLDGGPHERNAPPWHQRIYTKSSAIDTKSKEQVHAAW